MSDELRVTVIVTGLGQAGDRNKRTLLETIKKDGTHDFSELERPTVIRKQGVLPQSTTGQTGSTAATGATTDSNEEVEYLDIPAFLRRQEEVTS